jgi:hypothetical protein
VLKNTASIEGVVKCRTFPLEPFERAVLGRLKEIDPHEILNGDSGPDETTRLRKDLDAVEGEIAEASAFMNAHGFSPTIGRRVADLEARQHELAELLAVARQKAEHPLSETWGEFGGLVEALNSEDSRLRLRAALRKMVEVIMLLVVPRGQDRICAVQVWFAGGKRHRDYLILHRPPKSNGRARVEGGTWTRSLADVVKLGPFDLRQPEHARKLEALLQSVPVVE